MYNPFDDPLHPSHTAAMHGHEAAERMLLADYERGTLPGAYLISGPRGIGKATLAYRYSKYLLAAPKADDQGDGLFGDMLPAEPVASLNTDPEHPAVRRVATGGHANMLIIEPGWDEKKKTRAKHISVEDVRRIGDFLSKSAAEEGYRIVIIDAADDMNTNAANAILKWLEEPPERAIFLLISHHPGALLPTIRSRCLALTLQPPSPELFHAIVTERNTTLKTETVQALYFLSGGAPGRALTLHEHGVDNRFQELMDLLGDESGEKELEAFAEKLTLGKGKLPFADVSSLLLSVLAGIIRAAHHDPDSDRAVPLPEAGKAFARLAHKKPLAYWLDLWEKSLGLLAEVRYVHLDARQVTASLLAAMAGKDSIVQYMRTGS